MPIVSEGLRHIWTMVRFIYTMLARKCRALLWGRGLCLATSPVREYLNMDHDRFQSSRRRSSWKNG